jgi:hypothetical protein
MLIERVDATRPKRHRAQAGLEQMYVDAMARDLVDGGLEHLAAKGLARAVKRTNARENVRQVVAVEEAIAGLGAGRLAGVEARSTGDGEECAGGGVKKVATGRHHADIVARFAGELEVRHRGVAAPNE